ncbi:hypothetical protein EJB05_34832 [Eragrostis curvula]|uniref:CR-type domain-containing protein n=1 Tax=Eragrostis curvula TaxID=38414 RepID=A0A5J9U6H9_9POAL|nr:hypothetical protein EJB05_34832 [Eragrostis curvula]
MAVEPERDGKEQRRPLLSGSGAAEQQHQQQYQYLGRSSSSVLRGGGNGWGGPEVSADEVRSAASFSSSARHYPPPASAPHGDNLYPYPPSIHSAVLSPSPSQSPAPATPHSHDGLAIVPQGPYPYGGSYQPSESAGRDVLDEVEIRQLLIDHVGHRCCWGSRPARTWKITSIEDCNVYVGTLETFIEERDVVTKKEPYDSGKIDGKDKGPVLGVWELDLRSEFPLLFVPEKEVMVKIPHSDVVEKCLDCEGRGETPCPVCNAGQEHGFYKANQMTRCSACYGRGLLAHQDGSDSVCGMCNGKGMLPCVACGSCGLVTCKTCTGYGSLLTQKNAHVRWKTLSARKVSAARGAASVPEEVFHRAKGVQLCNIQAYQCTPAFFADSYPLNQFSSEVIASRLPVPPSARVISERHIISVVPVTRVTMAHRKQSFSFYVVGYSRDVFIRDYPSKFCWGLCCCFEWLGKSAASFSSSAGHYPPRAVAPYGDNLHPYPPSIHSAVLSPSPSQSPAPASPHSHGMFMTSSGALFATWNSIAEGLAIVPQGPYPYGGSYQPSESVGRVVGFADRDVLDEVEIRQLLIDHVGHRCCWGSCPARTWKITSIEDRHVYVGTLETFIEERDIVTKKEPYESGKIDGRDNGPVLGVWELDLRSEFPLLFVPEKEVMIKIPHTEVVEKCLDCESRGETPCPICNAGKEHGFYKANQMTRCSACYGSGLLADQDGSDSVCAMCNGKGMLPCVACGSRGIVTSKTCTGYGYLLAQKNAHVRWKTLSARKVSAARGAASVPEEVFHRARGVQLCNIQAYQCAPAFFADSYPLNQFSSEVIASRLPVPPSARVISERHIISVVPVTRVTMAHRKQSFSFYIVGYNWDVFIRDYPSKFCWGLCCCFEWLGK